jgi:hypothetical protein
MSDGACEICRNWLVERFTEYSDGSRITNWKPAKEGCGLCDVLKIETPADFGCKSFGEGHVHTERAWKNGAPYMHWTVGPCPGCTGNGSVAQFTTQGGYPQITGGSCDRCKGTGKVRHYDDGFVGNESDRMHPKEKEIAEPLTCRRCSKSVEVTWMVCPFCGNRLEGEAAVEIVEGALGSGGEVDLKSPLPERREQLGREIDAMNAQNAQLSPVPAQGGSDA